MFLENIH